MAILTWMKHPIAGLAVEHGVLRASDIQQLADMHLLLESTSKQAETMLTQARDDAAALMARARDDVDALHHAAEAEIADLQQQVREEAERRFVMEWHERERAGALAHLARQAALHQQLANVVSDAVERMVVSEDREALFKRALAHVDDLGLDLHGTKLRIHASDHLAADAFLRSVNSADQGRTLQLVVDASLVPGSCVFESDAGMLDASLDTQLSALRAALGRAISQCPVVAEPATEHPVADDDLSASGHAAAGSPP